MKGSDSRWARERGGSEQEHGEERMDSMVKEGRLQEGKREQASRASLPKRGRRKHEQVSGCKSSPGRSAESWFYSYSGQT